MADWGDVVVVKIHSLARPAAIKVVPVFYKASLEAPNIMIRGFARNLILAGDVDGKQCLFAIDGAGKARVLVAP